jgi:hypothetical protein
MADRNGDAWPKDVDLWMLDSIISLELEDLPGSLCTDRSFEASIRIGITLSIGWSLSL